MPFLRAPNGSKMNFSQARLSALLSLVYQDVYGQKIPKYRATIHRHSTAIWKALEEAYGAEETAEWPGSGIYHSIEEELRINSNTAVHESFLSMRINEFQDPKENSGSPFKNAGPQTGATAKTWEKTWEGQAAQRAKIAVSGERIDPVWAIVYEKEKESSQEGTEDGEYASKQTNEAPSGEKRFLSLAERMGMAINPVKPDVKPKALEVVAARRSTWIKFWKSATLATGMDFPAWHAWEKHIMSLSLDQKHLSLDAWWLFWQEQIDACLRKDPRVHELRKIILERKKRGSICGQSWLAGTELSRTDAPMKLETSPTGHVWYRRLAVEHLKQVFSDLTTDEADYSWDWNTIARHIKPERDQLLNWNGWQHLDEAGGLWPVALPFNKETWASGDMPHEDAREMPQWAMMRMSMALCMVDNEPEHRLQNALELYDHISEHRLIPGASVWREAGKRHPEFFEDNAWWIEDDYMSIQDAVHASATDTVWTGTVASMWGRVRSKNAPVKEGRRKSTGVNDFLRIINAHMLAQGRVGSERPVTPQLPCWHLDMEEFINLRHEGGRRLQPVLLISDLFMQRLAEGKPWTLFDPHIYPEVLDHNGYIEAEKCIPERKKQHPTAHKTLPSEKIWKKILTLCRTGSPYIVFEDSDKAYSPNATHNLIHGIDGVGSFPVFEDTKDRTHKISWPAMAVNIDAMMTSDGIPDFEKWQSTITWAFWMAEQMYAANEDILTEETLYLRPLCLGAVGFYEAVRKASEHVRGTEEDIDMWVSQVSETWGALVSVADQVFCQKHGAAPCWGPTLLHQHQQQMVAESKGLHQREDNSFPFAQRNEEMAPPLKIDITDYMQPFHPKRSYERLKKQRKGGTSLPEPKEVSQIYDEIKAHRFSVRTVWAPFRQLASWAGVSPGGFGTLFPIEWVLDENRIWRLAPTSFMVDSMSQAKDPQGLGVIFEYPENPGKWPEDIRKLSAPDMEEWNRRLKHASMVRIWVDQGVSLTLPSGIQNQNLGLLLQKAWWGGISNVRFEDPLRKPENVISSSDASDFA